MMEIADVKKLDEVMSRLGYLIVEISFLENELAIESSKLIESYQTQTAGYKAEKEELEAAMIAYCEANPGLFNGKKSLSLTWGRISSREAEQTDVPKEREADVITALRCLGHDHCIRTEQKLDRNTLRTLADNVLETLGILRKKVTRWKFEPNIRLIAEMIGKG